MEPMGIRTTENQCDASACSSQMLKPKGGCGAASMLIAYGKDNTKALFQSGLGFTLPVIKPSGDVQGKGQFVGDTACPNKNPPHSVETRQSIPLKKGVEQ